MTKIMIISEDSTEPRFRASYQGHESVGRSAGAALDALTEQLPPSESSTFIVIQNQRPDEFFTASQQQRLRELLAIRRASEQNGGPMPPDDEAELEKLVAEELSGSTKRAAAMAYELGL